MRNVKFNAIYTPGLHLALLEGKYPEQMDVSTGIFLVMFRVFRTEKNGDILIYNYIYYPEVFVKSLLWFLVNRGGDYTESLFYRTWGDYFCLIDDSLFKGRSIEREYDEFLQKLKKVYPRYNEYYNNHVQHSDPIISKESHKNVSTIFYGLKKLVLVKNMEYLINFVDLAAKKEYSQLCGLLLKQEMVNGLEFNNNDLLVNGQYLIRDCLFVVQDLDLLLKKLKKDKGWKKESINKGARTERAQPTTMLAFLSCLDSEYRNTLYNHYDQLQKKGSFGNTTKLSRTHFTFRRIHQNISGNIKWYSTSTKKMQEIKNKQNLFEKNYGLITNIIDEYSNLNKEELQRKIELELWNQGKIFSVDKTKYTKESYDILISKHDVLCKLLEYPDNYLKTLDFNIRSSKYIPCINEILKELEVDVVAKLLLSYFLEILKKEIYFEKYDYNVDGNNVTESDDIDGNSERYGVPTISCFNDFGKKIYSLYIYNLYKKSELYKKKSLSVFKSLNSSKFWLNYVESDNNFYAKIGGEFVANLLTINLFTQELHQHPKDRKKTSHYVVVSQDIKNKLLKNNFNLYYVPQKLPMVCEPKEYRYDTDPFKNKLGGYILNDEKYVTNLIKPRIGYEEPTVLDSNSIVVDLVNGVSKKPFKINTDTLNYIYKYGVEKKILIDDSNKEIQHYLNNPSVKINNELKSIISKLMVEKNVLNIAETYSRFDKIYFPLVLDFRTRLYCETVYFDYQKDDLAKGLISFAKPGVITKYDDLSFSFFKAYGANMYGQGLDKKSLNSRVKWIDDNSERILNFEFNDIVDNAKNKPSFISFCFEYKNYVDFMNSKESTLFYTYLPIRLDASCNGYQHLVLLTKEVKLLNKLNLDISTYEDDPNDFYTYLKDNTNEFITNEIKRLGDKLENKNVNLEKLKANFNKISKQVNKIELEKLYNLFKSNHLTTNNIDPLNVPKKKRIKGKSEKDLVNNEIQILYKKIDKNMKQNEEISIIIKDIKTLEKEIKELESYKKLKNIQLDRSVIKKIVMRESYSASIPRLVSEIKNEMREIVEDNKTYYVYSNSDIKLTQYDIAIYILSLKNVTTKLAPSVNNLSKYLDGIVKVCTELDIPIPWILPHKGATIKASYLTEVEESFSAFSFTKTKYTFKKYLKGKYDLKKQKRAIRPNLIHSLDASAIAMLYQDLGNIDLFTIHDCFAVTANNVSLLVYKLKKVYRKMYSSNIYLLEFDNVLRLTLNKTFGDKVFPIDGYGVDITQLDVKKKNKIPFPDVKKVVNVNSNIDNLSLSSYPVN